MSHRCILEKLDGTLSTVTIAIPYQCPPWRRLCTLIERSDFGTARSFNRIALIPQEDLFEAPRNVCIKRIRLGGFCRLVTPMFVHPEPWGRISSHIRLKCVPACLRDLLMRHPGGVVDLRVEDHPVTPVRQRLAVGGNYWRTGPFMQPGVRGGHAFF